MNIKLNKSDYNKVNELISINNMNIQISEMMFYLLNNISSFTKENIDKYKKEYNCDEKEAFLHIASDIWGIDIDNDENIDVINNYLLDAFNKLDKEKYLNNLYYKNIKIKPHKEKEYELTYDHYHGYEIFPLSDVSFNDYYEQTKFAYFDSRFDFVALNYKSHTWMSITPNEINTMENSVNAAKGNVLVMGLGLGYYPYMISNKDNVNKITIIEKDKKIIEIFKKEILPLFNHKDKIEIINDDAVNYLKTTTKVYDYVFVDLWHNPEDGLPLYLTFKGLEYILDKATFSYWLEDGILAYLRRITIILIEEILNGSNDSNYVKSECDEDRIINKLYLKTKDINLLSFDEINKFLESDNLIKLLK